MNEVAAMIDKTIHKHAGEACARVRCYDFITHRHRHTGLYGCNAKSKFQPGPRRGEVEKSLAETVPDGCGAGSNHEAGLLEFTVRRQNQKANRKKKKSEQNLKRSGRRILLPLQKIQKKTTREESRSCARARKQRWCN